MTKFLNISTDNTLGGNSPSDVAVSSQKAVKEYVDSQTGTAPAFANITGQPTDNTNLASALNAKYDASNPNGYTSNVGTVTSVNSVSPVNGNVTLSIPTVDQTYSASSANAQSGVAIAGANFLVNNAAGSTNGVAVKGSGSVQSTQIGALGSASSMSTSVGFSAYATGSQSITIGHGAQASASKSYAFGEQAKSTAIGAFQFGQATNSEAGSVYFGLTTDGSTTTNYKLLGSDGKIPDDRISTNIARATDIPTVNNATLTITQGGTTKGTFTANASSNVTIDLDSGGSVDVDNKSITTNSSDEIQTVGVINSRDSSTAVKTWTGTKAQYNAIVTKDANTLYNITDDTDVSLTILEALYPVGSVYITTADTCPLSTLISGSTWTLVSTGIVKSGEVPVKGNGMTLGLTNGTDNCGAYNLTNYSLAMATGNIGTEVGTTSSGTLIRDGKTVGVVTDSTKSGIIADTSSLTLSVNIFERTA